jgi:hypothetical protein
MKCPRCWADKAYVRRVDGWKGALLGFLFVVPMRCHHCYHKFHVPWLLTIGRTILPPPLKTVPVRSARPSIAATHTVFEHATSHS